MCHHYHHHFYHYPSSLTSLSSSLSTTLSSTSPLCLLLFYSNKNERIQKAVNQLVDTFEQLCIHIHRLQSTSAASSSRSSSSSSSSSVKWTDAMNEVVVSNLTNSLKELISKAHESIQSIHTDYADDDGGNDNGYNSTKLQHKNNNGNDDDDDDSIFLVNLRAIDHQLRQLQVRSDTTTSSGNNGSSSSAHNSKNRLMNASTMSPKQDVQSLFQKRDMEADRLQLCIQVGR